MKDRLAQLGARLGRARGTRAGVAPIARPIRDWFIVLGCFAAGLAVVVGLGIFSYVKVSRSETALLEGSNALVLDVARLERALAAFNLRGGERDAWRSRQMPQDPSR